MADKTTLPYGGWPSVITADLITAGSVTRNFPCEVDGVVYWQETRPLEQGRTTVVALQPDGSIRDLLPFPESTQSKVHEYGGLCWLVTDGQLFYARKSDQRIYKTPLDRFSPAPLTPESGGCRFADFCYDVERHRLIAVAEIHKKSNDFVGAGLPAIKVSATTQIASRAGPLPQNSAAMEIAALQIESHPANCIVAIPLDGSACDAERLQVLGADADFFAYPRLSPDGNQLCWIAWHHPQMPWDGTELYCAAIGDDGSLAQPTLVAGSASESIFQPAWSPDGQLHFVSDRSGWWNLYHWDGATCLPLLPMAAEFASPLWNLGQSTYGFIDSQRIAALYAQDGKWHLSILENSSVGRASARQPSSIAAPCRAEARPTTTSCNDMSSLSTTGGKIYFVGASAHRSGDIFRLDNGELTALTDSTPALDLANISNPEPICFPTSDGDSAYGFFYPPANASCKGPYSDKPPLIVMCHGGPTGANCAVLNYKIQYWTSRGFALLDVNYRGSTGFGRQYREKLNLNWGLVDVADAAAGVDYLIAENLVDPDRVIIRGSSAGGYTVLAALTFTDRFKAGASLYGIGDLETLARDTHKFEARYLDSLVGPYPEQQELYRQRSPINHPEKLNCPVIFLQGLEDKVVPPNQAEAMVSALDQRGIPVAYVTFPDEGHGFRKAENIKTALEAELYFYRAVLGIQSQEALPTIPIRNEGQAVSFKL